MADTEREALRALVAKWQRAARFDDKERANGGDAAWGHRAEIHRRCANDLEAILTPKERDAILRDRAERFSWPCDVVGEYEE
jgi:hypothetical protein